eukprot:scaffold195027_cov19-Tisochrysis_lutea.AAC.9
MSCVFRRTTGLRPYSLLITSKGVSGSKSNAQTSRMTACISPIFPQNQRRRCVIGLRGIFLAWHQHMPGVCSCLCVVVLLFIGKYWIKQSWLDTGECTHVRAAYCGSCSCSALTANGHASGGHDAHACDPQDALGILMKHPPLCRPHAQAAGRSVRALEAERLMGKAEEGLHPGPAGATCYLGGPGATRYLGHDPMLLVILEKLILGRQTRVKSFLFMNC